MQWLVIGLGAMGEAFARRLTACGDTVVGVDPADAARARVAATDGVLTFADPSQAEGWDGAFVIVRTPSQVEAALASLAGSASAGDRPAPVFVCSTIDPDTARRLGTWSAEALRVIEAPVTGLVQGALEGRLTMMVAGHVSQEDVSLLRRTLARRVVMFEAYGQPALAKLLNNTLLAYNLHALTAVLEFAANHGLPPVRLQEVLSEGSGGSFAAAHLRTLVPDLIDKDVDLLIRFLGQLPPVQPGTSPVTPVAERARRLVDEPDA